jgi:hypothetical protein
MKRIMYKTFVLNFKKTSNNTHGSYIDTKSLSNFFFLIEFSLKLEQTYAHIFMYHYKLAIKNISQVEINSIISKCVLT